MVKLPRTGLLTRSCPERILAGFCSCAWLGGWGVDQAIKTSLRNGLPESQEFLLSSQPLPIGEFPVWGGVEV